MKLNAPPAAGLMLFNPLKPRRKEKRPKYKADKQLNFDLSKYAAFEPDCSVISQVAFNVEIIIKPDLKRCSFFTYY